MEIIQTMTMNPMFIINRDMSKGSEDFAGTIQKFSELYRHKIEDGYTYVIDCTDKLDDDRLKIHFWEHKGSIHDFKDFIIAAPFHGLFIGTRKNSRYMAPMNNLFLSKPDHWPDFVETDRDKVVQGLWKAALDMSKDRIIEAMGKGYQPCFMIDKLFGNSDKEFCQAGHGMIQMSSDHPEAYKAVHEFPEDGCMKKCTYIASMPVVFENKDIKVHVYMEL